MVDLIEIYVHWYAGRSQVQIAQLGGGPQDGAQVPGPGCGGRVDRW